MTKPASDKTVEMFTVDTLNQLTASTDSMPASAGGDAWQLTGETRYLYDGILLVQERDGNNTPTVTYTRGRDLSGTLEGAGGIGGLLARSHGYSGGGWSGHNYYHADGNGNVTALVDSGGTLQAGYRYDPYGRLLDQTGPLADTNVMRWSSKPWVGFSGSATDDLYYYGYRFYEPYLQRWPNRDPLGTSADFHTEFPAFEYYNGGGLYHFVYNNPINSIDPFGLDVWIVRDKCSKWGHEWVVGDNGDGTYWDSNKMPGKGPLAPVNCPADIQFNPKSGINPKNLNNPCLEIRRHVVTSSAVDKKVRDEAEKRAKEDKGRYDALGSNCRDYSQSLCDYAVGAKLREQLEQRKGK